MKNLFQVLFFSLAAATMLSAQNLVITSVDVPEGPFQPGDNVEVTATVLNADDVNPLPAGSNTVVTLEVNGIAGTFSSLPINSVIAPEGELDVTILIPILQTTANGFYPVEEISVDAFTANNVGTFEVRAFADLAIEEFEISDGPYYPGSPISYTIDYANIGERDAGAFIIRVNVVAPPTGTGYRLERIIAGGLAAGESGRVVLTLADAVPGQDGVVPLDNPNGTFEVTATIDANNDVPEDGRLANNTAELTFDIDTKPELAIVNLSYEAGVWEPGDPVDFSLTFANLPFWDSHGTLRVENRADQRYRIDVVLSTDTIFGNEDDFLLYSVIFTGHPDGGNFLPGDDFTLQWSQAMPRNLAGDYFVLARIDVSDNIDEYVNDDPMLNGNNTWYDTESAKITITPGPAPQPTTYRASVNAEGQEGDNISDEPSLSDDGRYLVFSSLAGFDEDDLNGYYDIYLRDNLTGKLTWITRPLHAGFGHGDSRLPQISGDGRYIVFQSDSDALTATDPNGHTDIFVYRVETGTLTQVTRSPSGAASNGSSYQPSISANGQWVVFESHAQNLLNPVVPVSTRQVYAYNQTTGEIHLASPADGGGIPDGQSFEATVNANGTHIVFVSEASDITADAVAGKQVYRVDIDGSNAVLVSQSAGVAGNGYSVNPDLSADGNIVVFSSLATNLDPLLAITNGMANAFIRDINAGTIERIVSPSGAEPNTPSVFDSGDVGVLDPRISADGRFVIFRTMSDNLLPLEIIRSDGTVYNLTDFGPTGYDPATDAVVLGFSDLNSTNNVSARAHSDIFLFDRENPEATRLISVNKFGYQGTSNYLVNDNPTSPSVRRAVISGNGRYIAFASEARGMFGFDHGRTNQITSNTNDVRDVYIHDLRTLGSFEFANPPVVELLNPVDGNVVTVGQSIVINASATDNNGYIETVDFYVNGILLDSVSRGDFFTHWTPQLPGVYTITAVATDNDGIRREDSVTITANDSDAPTVSLIYPVSGDSYFTNSEITLGAVATSTGSGITEVEFYVDGESIGVAGSPPFTANWSAVGPGTYLITAVARNTVGQQGISNPVQITIVDPSAPTVTITAPTPGDTLTVDATSAFAATATGSGVLIDRVEYFVNGQSIGLASSQDGVWYIDFTPQSLGVAEVRALATDSSGNTYSSAIEVYPVVSGIPPMATIISPNPSDTVTPGLADQTLQRGVEYLFSVEASDPDGHIAAVEFYLGGRSIGEAVEATTFGLYELSYTPTLLGNQLFRALVRDNTGNVTAVQINYQVVSGTSPIATITAPSPVDLDLDGVADQELQRNTTYQIAATAVATAVGASVAEVRYFANGELLGVGEPSVTLGNYVLSWRPELSGLWDITIEVEDSLGTIATDSVTYSVVLGSAPQVNLTAVDADLDGIADELLTVLEPYTLEASASDVDGNIRSVTFFIDGEVLGEGVLNTTSGNYEISWSPPALGLFIVDAVATDNDGNEARSRLRFQVQTGFAPVVTLLGDLDNDGIYDDDVIIMSTITLAAEAIDPDGLVEQVEFFANGDSIGMGVFDGILNAYVIEWTPSLQGSNVIRAVATDNSGNVGIDELIFNVTVGAAPVVNWVAPNPIDNNADGIADENLRLNESVEIVVNATDLDGTVERVEFFVNGSFLGEGVESGELNRYVIAFTPSLTGLYAIEAVAIDNSGNRTSETHVFNVVTGSLPQITILSPDPTDSNSDGIADVDLLVFEPQTLAANILHPDGFIETVEVWINGRFVGNAEERGALNRYALDYTPSLTGQYLITFRAYDDLGNQASSSLRYNVVAGTAPLVSILYPEDSNNDGIADEVFLSGQSIELRVHATDPDGQIAEVEFFINGSSIGQAQITDWLDEYVIVYNPPFLGTYLFRADVTDNSGNRVSVQQQFTVTSGSVPVVEILAPDPTDGSGNGIADVNLTVNQSVTLAASAEDADGFIDSVEFSINGTLLGLALLNPATNRYELPFVFSTIGIYRFDVDATDNLGNRTRETAFYQVSSGMPPVVELISPDPSDLNGDGFADMTLPVQRSLQWVATATDGDGFVESVEFIVNGQSLGFATESGAVGRYVMDYTPVLTGNYNVIVIATDNLGNQTSVSHNFQVTPGIAPVISILSPPEGGSYLPGTNLPVQVVASDEDGLVVSVAYYLNGVLVSNVATPPFRTTIALPSPGNYILEAVATDNDGNRTVSAPRLLTAGPPDPNTPLVVVNHPLPLGDGDTVNDVSVASSMYFNAEVNSAHEIVDVRFYINGQLLGSAQGQLGNTWSLFYQPNAQGNYVIMAEAEDANGNIGQSVPILLDVGPLDSPLPIAQMRQPFPFSPADKPIEMFVDVDGGLVDIDRVDFFANGVLIGSQNEEVEDKLYGFVWTPPSSGVYRLSSRIVQIDPAGLEWDNWKLTSEVLVEVTPRTVDTPPSVVLHYPLDGSQLTTASRVIMQAGAADTDSTVERIDFYINNEIVGSASSAPYQFTWVPGEIGNYALVAVAYDPEGNYTISSTRQVVVNPSGGYPPAVQIVEPNPADLDGNGVSDTLLMSNVPTRFATLAVDPDGLIDSVEFYVNGVFIGEGEESVQPGIWEFNWAPQTTGRIHLVVVARDTLNNENFSTASYDVIATIPPVVELTSPNPADANNDGIADETLNIGAMTRLEAFAEAYESRNISQVEFFLDGSSLGTATESQQKGRFVLDWQPILAGNFEIHVVATDSLGLTAVDSMFYSVNTGELPVVNFVRPTGSNPTAGSDVLIEVEATRDGGYVDQVQFFINQVPLGTPITEVPFLTFWKPGSSGSYTIEARATDNSGNVVSEFHTVNVTPPVGIVPAITLSATASGNITPGSRVMVRANVIDDNPESVTFFLNGSPIKTADTAPYYVIIDPVIGIPPNRYEVLAVVTDADGNSSIARQEYYISDVAVTPPDIQIVTPQAGDQLTFGSRTAIRADVSGENLSQIREVVFYANGERIGSDTSEPYLLDWVPQTLGQVEITAAVLLNQEQYDHDNNFDTPPILVSPINIALPRTVQVNPAVGELPSISMQILPSRTNLAIGSRVLLYADVQDTDGDLDDLTVEFFIDGAPLRRSDGSLVGPVVSPPFATTWVATRQGRFFLNATVTDANGNVVSSSYQNIDVSQRVVTDTPVIQLNVPSSGRQGSLLSLNANVQDFVNGPELVTFYVNGEPIHVMENASPPYTFNWLASLYGEVEFFATAQRTLSDGNILTTASSVISRNLAQNQPPVIESFTYSFPGQNSQSKPNPLRDEVLTFTVIVTDDGPLDRVELLRNGEKVAESTRSTSPFELMDTPPDVGIYEYSLVVTDRGGAQTQSDESLVVSVTTGLPPVVLLTNPSHGSTALPNVPITLRASASDPDGTVTSVQFYVNGQAEGSAITTAPYQTTFVPQIPGDYIITARARDNSGNETISSPATISVLTDNPPQFLEFSNDLPANIARLNQPIRWLLDTEDDFGVVEVRLFRNSVALDNPTGVDVPVEILDTPPNTGRFTYFAEARDTGGNITRSASIEVEVTRGAVPTVVITTPQSGVEVAIGTPVTIRATALPGVEPSGVPAGSIAQVEFFRNNQSIAVLTSAPYITSFTPSADAEYTISAVATTDTGRTNTANSAEITIIGVDGSVPEITSFTNNTINNFSLTGVNITFTVEANDEQGIDRVELVQGNQLIGTAIGQPYRLSFKPDVPGVYSFFARAINVDGKVAVSDPVQITVRFPDPLQEDNDFVYQTFLDLLLRAPTAEQQNLFSSRLESGDLSRDRFIREVIDLLSGDRREYDVKVQDVFVAHRLMLGEWPNRSQLERDAGVVADAGLISLVENYLPEFENRYVSEINDDPLLQPRPQQPITRLPSTQSGDTEIGWFLDYLFKLKYGVFMDSNQKARGLSHFRLFGLNTYVVDFVQDMEVFSTSNAHITSGIAFRFNTIAPPSDQLKRRATAASLIVNLLRIEADPDEVARLADKLWVTQVAEILNDPRYEARFLMPFGTMYHYVDGWKHADWFGWFNATNEPYIYHVEYGWVSFDITGQSPNDFWFHDPKMGWNWTDRSIYPLFYNLNESRWLQSTRSNFEGNGSPRAYLDLRSGEWIQR